MTQKIIIDCDPGVDDAVAILMALTSPEVEVLGVTTNVGNVSLYKTQLNARRVCEVAGRLDMKVFAGCPRSLFNRFAPESVEDTAYTAADIHGESGLGGSKLPAPTMPLQDEHAVNFIIRTLENSTGDIIMVCTGALTNMATALIMSPQIAAKIQKIVLMGGAIGLGNITPAAEYNFYCDPEAAHVVFTSKIPIVMFGLDVTRQTEFDKKWVDEIEALNSPVAQALVDILSDAFKPGAYAEPGTKGTGKVLHDVNCIAYLINPSLYEGRNVYVEIDTSDTINSGRSTVDWWNKIGKEPNALVMNKVKHEAFFALLTERISRYPKFQKSANGTL
ncbi:Nucleoside hydrolase [Candidatus Bealeia paramacronuclearis]|uniref:Nucleoside hydrolase n=1 Tax=Candidatus Bealeia paramacronuclearis TaxID=1921001 RepID=A0ABZ2C2G1_9PROT|nr:Nucleoside hydrolase [Candidatus Bealeia paramacronuclearis]